MAAPCVAVAYSGGRDSSALLHATLTAAADQGLRVVALHVHHGLGHNADGWLVHCAQKCRRWAKRGFQLSFDHRRLTGRPARGDSVEAWARGARYAALREMAIEHDATLVLLAHHRQDQAETLLLQALRGAGVAGLAAMPRSIERDGITWLRPWLEVSPDSIAAYARRYRLRHVEDDSNADPRYARNRLRLEVWPRLRSAFPQAEASLASSAAWSDEARQCADDLAAIDMAEVVDARGLVLDAWVRLSPARQSNVLRTWLKAQTGASIAAPTIRRLLAELPARSPAEWHVGSFVLRRYRGHLACRVGSSPAATQAGAKAKTLEVGRAGTYAPAGWGGRLRVRRVREGGVSLACLRSLVLAERSGSEQFQVALGRPVRSLKKQFQAASVPAWQRTGPLVYCGGQLLYVPGLGIDARAVAGKGAPQASLEWLPDVG